MKIAIPGLVDPAASIVVRTASHGPFAVKLVDCTRGVTKRVVALGDERSGRQDVSDDIPVHQVARRLFDGFEVRTDVQPEIASELVSALVTARQARIVAE